MSYRGASTGGVILPGMLVIAHETVDLAEWPADSDLEKSPV